MESQRVQGWLNSAGLGSDWTDYLSCSPCSRGDREEKQVPSFSKQLVVVQPHVALWRCSTVSLRRENDWDNRRRDNTVPRLISDDWKSFSVNWTLQDVALTVSWLQAYFLGCSSSSVYFCKPCLARLFDESVSVWLAPQIISPAAYMYLQRAAPP